MPSTTRASTFLHEIAHLRWIVGSLGSKNQYGWWDCSFLDETGIRFLTSTFPRTAKSAAFRATCEAAQKTHDQAMGKKGSYHLFRLPISVEEALRNLTPESEEILSKDTAMEALKKLAAAGISAPSGPVQIGVEKKILTEDSVSELAAHYHSAFNQGIRCYPYFSPDTR